MYGFYSWQKYFLDLLGKDLVWVTGVIAGHNPMTFLVGQTRRLYLGAGPVEAPATALLAIALCIAALALAANAVASRKGMRIE